MARGGGHDRRRAGAAGIPGAGAARVRPTPSAALHYSRHRAPDDVQDLRPAVQAPVHHPTRQLTRGPADWSTRPDSPSRPTNGTSRVSGEFGGIAMSEFIWARQHARRMMLIWVAVVLAVTGLVAAVAWTIGSHLAGCCELRRRSVRVCTRHAGRVSTNMHARKQVVPAARGKNQSRNISATRNANSSDCWVFSRGSHAVS